MTLLVAIMILLQDPLPPADEKGPGPERGRISVMIANDVMTGSDDYFSNGWIVSWHSRPLSRWEDLLPDWLAWLPGAFPGSDAPLKRVSVGFSQLIFTPGNIEIDVPEPEDTPYSGALLGALSFSAQDDDDAMTAWQLVAGVVGPASLAEETQLWAHSLFNAARPQGWDYQLEDEFILNLHAQHKRTIASGSWTDDLGAQAGLVVGGALGNMATQVDAALEFRAGWHMPPGFEGDPIGRKLITYGYTRETEPPGFSLHVFASAAVRGWAHFIFLDGNTWKESPSLERNTWTAVLGSGVSASLHRVRLTLEFGATSRPVEGVGGFDSFGSFTFAYAF